ncbi:L-cystine-binding protein FliY [Methylobacterium crusticola]|uniref:L-cystine-binding protein FliY n=1 Tax=Methylobacterium crusticola TaxID=1697972 RepID=A0ABQ4QXK3_9HYPH|nr:ABC transporter substrate-binding protein [Methylobacterium crusticola]GJD49610.1 L-cystine-binding protein FliY [Methylobacterium crusticola]
MHALLRCLAAGAALLVPALAQAQACKPAVADADLVKPGKLVMSTNPTLPPLQFVDSSGELKGMRVELGTEIARRLCLSPEYVRIEFSAMVPGLQAGRWDMINTGIFFTEERARIMQMIPYENQAISISVGAGAKRPIAGTDDLAGLSVGVEMGGFEERHARLIDADLRAKGLKGLTIRTFDNFALAFQALRAGQVDATVSIDGVAEEYARRGDFKHALGGLYPTPVAVAFKNRALAAAVAKVLGEMKADGSFDALFRRYGVVPSEKALAVVGPA